MTRPLRSDRDLDYSPDSPSIWRNRLGSELRRLREASGLRLQEAGDALGMAASSMSRIERGQAPVKVGFLTTLFTVYGISNLAQRKRLLDMARKGQSKGCWGQYTELLSPEARHYLGLEAAASQLYSFSLQTIPSLLQTEDYAAAVLTVTRPDLRASQLQDLVWIRMHRQEVVRRSGCRLDLVIDESALMRTVGSAQIMARQVDHVVEVAAKPNVTVRLVSLGAVHSVLTFPYTVLSFAHPDDEAVVCYRGSGNQRSLTTDRAHVEAAQRLHGAMSREAVVVEGSLGATMRILGGEGMDGNCERLGKFISKGSEITGTEHAAQLGESGLVSP